MPSFNLICRARGAIQRWLGGIGGLGGLRLLAMDARQRPVAQKYSQIRLIRPEVVTAANATRNAVVRSLSMMPRR